MYQFCWLLRNVGSSSSSSFSSSYYLVYTSCGKANGPKYNWAKQKQLLVTETVSDTSAKGFDLHRLQTVFNTLMTVFGRLLANFRQATVSDCLYLGPSKKLYHPLPTNSYQPASSKSTSIHGWSHNLACFLLFLVFTAPSTTTWCPSIAADNIWLHSLFDAILTVVIASASWCPTVVALQSVRVPVGSDTTNQTVLQLVNIGRGTMHYVNLKLKKWQDSVRNQECYRNRVAVYWQANRVSVYISVPNWQFKSNGIFQG